MAITTVTYFGVQNKAVVASLTSDLDKASKLVSLYETVNGNYPNSLSEVNDGNGVLASSGTSYEDYFPMTNGYCIAATKSSISYRITNYTAPRVGRCSGSERDKYSVIKWASWTLGSGGVTGYTTNGDGNSRIIDSNPWDASDVIWDVSDQDVDSNADGGWNTSSFLIDSTKMYRFSTFVRRKNIGNGNFYLGLSGSPNPVLNRSNGSTNSNPYFRGSAWWGNANDWYLVVGHVWPAGSGTGAVMSDSAVYMMNGLKVAPNYDYVWQSTTTSTTHRSYLYYSTDIATNQQWYQPRVDVVDGTEPTVNELLNNIF